TTFRVFLPASATRARASTPPFDPAALRASLRGTVLLVDDEEMLRRTGCKILERLGYTVYEAKDGDEALALLEQRGASVQLVLTDVSMPNTGGIALREAASARYPHLKWILASGYSPGSPDLGELSAGGVAMLTKPYGIAELAQAVRRELDGVPEKAS
ncbi:MAG: response regulator, partial [Gemmatimonadales bacterium]|nr:response regulator [Gemmatimonadales bacterium]